MRSSLIAAFASVTRLTQQQMADATGISLPTYWRLEHHELSNPPLRYMTNCALVLGVGLEAVIEDEWRKWFVCDERRAQPPRGG